jgi:hypothetical protein
MLNERFFSPDVEFRPVMPSSAERGTPIMQRFVFTLSRLSFAAAVTVFSLQPVTSTQPEIVPAAVVATNPSPELTEEIVAAYRAASSEDLELAEAGLADYVTRLDADDEA